MVCVGHLYGVALYYISSFAEFYLKGTSHSRPEFQYFWVYFVGFNLPWVVVPLGTSCDIPSQAHDGTDVDCCIIIVLLVSSVKSLHKAMAVMAQVESTLGRKNKTVQILAPAPTIETSRKKR
jgi:hypothetical protein